MPNSIRLRIRFKDTWEEQDLHLSQTKKGQKKNIPKADMKNIRRRRRKRLYPDNFSGKSYALIVVEGIGGLK